MIRIERWKVQREMQRAGIETYKELAERIGVSAQTVSNWLGGASWTPENLSRMCEVLDCQPGDILTLGPAPKATAPAGALVAA